MKKLRFRGRLAAGVRWKCLCAGPCLGVEVMEVVGWMVWIERRTELANFCWEGRMMAETAPLMAQSAD